MRMVVILLLIQNFPYLMVSKQVVDLQGCDSQGKKTCFRVELNVFNVESGLNLESATCKGTNAFKS